MSLSTAAVPSARMARATYASVASWYAAPTRIDESRSSPATRSPSGWRGTRAAGWRGTRAARDPGGAGRGRRGGGGLGRDPAPDIISDIIYAWDDIWRRR
jgi:hypothetical protein